jgi:hypothetical protein
MLDMVTLGPARRRRRMRKVLGQLDRHDEIARLRGQDPLQAWTPPRDAPVVKLKPRRRRRASTRVKERSKWANVIFIGLVLAVVVVSILNRNGALFGGPAAAPAPFPPAGAGEQSKPLGSPPQSPAGTGGYAFAHTQAGTTLPVTWDPCRAIHYVVAGTPPPGQGQVVTQAIARMSKATGFNFVYDGTTTERVTAAGRFSYQPDRYGKRWAPLLIDWTSPSADTDLAGSTLPVPVLAGDHLTYVSGTVALDTPRLTQVAQAGNPAIVKATLLHNLGLALGLAPVSDPAEIMYSKTPLKATDLGPGDLRGLAQLGQGTCAPGI